MNNENILEDIANKELIDMTQIAKVLGLKYHTARKIIFDDNSLMFVKFGKRKRLWLKEEILEFKRKHCQNFNMV